MKHKPIILIFLIGTGVVFYFSWKSNPDLEANEWIPLWLTTWANKNYNFRTAIPFMLMGVFISSFFRQSFRFYILCWMAMIVMVVIAEAGQLYLPGRSFDFWDIFYGVAGGAIGLITGKVFKFFVK
ncbi:MAG: VanZ family protein [Sphingobacteriales bacterium]|jgi:VanZ family protein|nr:VanZ family protein [Sphingobacteriales bacterium]